ncbi:hypothetical protein QTP86_027938 [Hemibagrus guttatus]|nr:hypothetical protein QTP86_027938 [Hemibagrus guttatus]
MPQDKDHVPMLKKSMVSCLNDYCPVTLTPIVMKCFERLVMRHIKTQHVRMLFIDFSSAFNTIIPQHLIEELSLLGLNTSLCNYSGAKKYLIMDFLSGRPQSVQIRSSISSTTTLSTGAPQGCVLSPLLFTPLTHIIKFSDDTTVVGLICKNEESAYREEVQQLTAWFKANNLSLNVNKTKEIVD